MDKSNNDSFIAHLAATAPALLQLVAVLSVKLVDVLKLNEFVFNPDFINIANFLIILLSISAISLASFWDYNRFSLKKDYAEDIFAATKEFWSVLKICFILSIGGFLLFIGIIIFKSEILRVAKESIQIWTFLQWFAYIVSMSSTSFILYAYTLLKIQQKNNKSLQENYIPRLLDSLRRNGHVSEPDIAIDSIDRIQNKAVVRIESNSKYEVVTDYSGEMISINKITQS